LSGVAAFWATSLLSIRAVDSLPRPCRTTLITIGQRIPHDELIVVDNWFEELKAKSRK
jgi:hypothetical protein